MNNRMLKPASRKKPDAWVYLIFIILGACLFLPIVLAGDTTLLPRYEDLAQWQNHREFIKKSFASGYFPLWCDGLFSGLDFAGWGHSTAFYAPAFFFFFFKYADASTLNQWLHFIIGISGFYFLARAARLKRESAFVSAAGYGFTYYLGALLGNYLSHSFVLAYVPWVFGLAIAMTRSRRLFYFAALVLALALQITGGHFEMIAIQNITLLAFICPLILLDPKCARPRYKTLVLLLTAFVLGALLAVVNLLPSVGSYAQSYRSLGFSYSYFARSADIKAPLVVLPWLVMLSFPAFALFFSCSFKKIRAPVYIALLLVIFISTLNAFNWFDYFKLLYHIPVLNKFPPRGISLHLAIMCIFLMFGIGLDNFPRSSRGKGLFLTATFIGLEIIFSYAVFQFLTGIRESFPPEFAALMKNYLLARKVIFVFMCVSGPIFFAILLLNKNPVFNSARVLGAVVLADFLLTGFFLPPRRDPDFLKPHPQYIKFLSGFDPGEFRVHSIFPSELWSEVRIPIQTGVLNDTRALDAFIFFSSARYSEFLKCLDDQALVLENGKIRDVKTPYILKTGDFLSRENLGLINLLNLKYIVGQDKNIKNSSSYDLAYEYYRFQPKINVFSAGSYKKISFRPPAQFGLLIYITQGDRLDLKVFDQNNGDRGLVFNLFFSDRSGLVKPASSRLINGRLNLDLDSLAGKTGTLIFEFIPLKTNPHENLEMALAIENKTGAKIFKRRDYPDIDVFENPSALPRFFLVHGARIIPEKAARLEYLKSREFNPEQTAVLEKQVYISFPEKLGALKGESAKLIKPGSFSGRYLVSVVNAAPAVLVFSEQYYPGWRAFLDGSEARVMPADHAFQGIVIPVAGSHTLVLKYQPAGFRIALWVEMASILWVAVLGAVVLARRRKDG